MPPPSTRRSVVVVEHDALPGSDRGAAAQSPRDADAVARAIDGSTVAVASRRARCDCTTHRARRPVRRTTRRRSTRHSSTLQIGLVADDHHARRAVDVEHVRFGAAAGQPDAAPLTDRDHLDRRHLADRRARPRRRPRAGVKRDPVAEERWRPPVDVMKHTSWLSGLAAVRSPRVGGDRAHLVPCRARRPGTACAPARAWSSMCTT